MSYSQFNTIFPTVFVFLFAASLLVAAEPDKDAQFQRLGEQYIQQFVKFEPVTATLMGDPLFKLTTLKWYLRDVTNAILDQAIHVDGISRSAAMRLMVEDAFQEEREAAAKWIRAQLTSAQLTTYFVGYLEHVALRREAEELWGDDFDLKSYHDKVLSFGSPPSQFVRALLLDQPIP